MKGAVFLGLVTTCNAFTITTSRLLRPRSASNHLRPDLLRSNHAAMVQSWYDAGVRLTLAEEPEECAVDDDKCLAERSLRVELRALQLFPLDPDLPALRSKITPLLATPGVDAQIMADFGIAFEAAEAARQEKARAVAKAEERAIVEARAEAIVQSVDVVVQSISALVDFFSEASPALGTSKAKMAAKEKTQPEAIAEDANDVAVAIATSTDQASEVTSSPPTRRRWWRRRRRFILFGKKLE